MENMQTETVTGNRQALTPNVVQQVLNQLMLEAARCDEPSPFDAGNVDYHRRTGGAGIVASQLADTAFANGIEWRVWIASVLQFFPDPPKMKAGDGATVALLRGAIDTLLRGAFDLTDANERDVMMERLDEVMDHDGLATAALHRIAYAITEILHDVSSARAVAADVARELACDMAVDRYGRGAGEVEAFLALLRELASSTV